MESPSRFEPTFSVNVKQIIAIVIVVGLIILIPVLIGYISNPDRRSPKEIINQTIETLKPDAEPQEDQLIIEVPLTNLKADLTIVKQNPQIVIFGGGVLLIIALIVFISLAKNALR